MPPNASKTVFVANIPFDVSEEQLANVFSEAGPVSNVEIKFDPQTGRSKGYAFVQFYDEATALSAVRNLQEVPVNGRALRVEASTDEPGPRRRGGGGGGGGGGTGGGGGGGGAGTSGTKGPAYAGAGYAAPTGRRDDTPPRPDFRSDGGFRRDEPPAHYSAPIHGAPPQGPVDINLLPSGQDLPPGQKATDAISKTLAAISPGQMQDVMASMKTLVSTNPEQARQLLSSKPQLAYALFQAMLLMNIVDPSVLQRIQPIPPAAAAPTYPPAGQNTYPSYPPAQAAQPPPSYPPYPAANSSYRPTPPISQAPAQGYNAAPTQQSYAPPTGHGYGAPPPAPAAIPPQAQGMAALPPSAQAALATLPEDQRAMLVQVLQLTPDQVSALDPQQKASIVQLRQQFLGTA